MEKAVIAMKAETKFIRKIKKTSEDTVFQDKHNLEPEKYFSRQRKLNYEDVIAYVIGNCRCSGELEAYRFCENLSCNEISATALRKARNKINYTAFYELFQQTIEIVPQEKCYHGYRIIAVDGMKGELPRTPEFNKKYSGSVENAPIFHAVAAFDVMNELFLDSCFHFGPADERQLAIDLLNQFCTTKLSKDTASIWLFDRGFPSLRVLQGLFEQNQKFVMRVSSSFLKEVNEFCKSKYVDRIVHVNINERRLQTNRVKSDGIIQFDLRCVRIQLSGGQEEILITNLEREEFPKRYMKELYGMRWGIETGFDYLKNSVYVEEFTSKNENGIQQDYYTSLLLSNFITCVCGSIWEDMPVKKRNN